MHMRLAELKKVCMERVAQYISDEQLATQEYNVGRVLSDIRNRLLAGELHEIDAVLGEMVG